MSTVCTVKEKKEKKEFKSETEEEEKKEGDVIKCPKASNRYRHDDEWCMIVPFEIIGPLL